MALVLDRIDSDMSFEGYQHLKCFPDERFSRSICGRRGRPRYPDITVPFARCYSERRIAQSIRTLTSTMAHFEAARPKHCRGHHVVLLEVGSNASRELRNAGSILFMELLHEKELRLQMLERPKGGRKMWYLFPVMQYIRVR